MFFKWILFILFHSAITSIAFGLAYEATLSRVDDPEQKTLFRVNYSDERINEQIQRSSTVHFNLDGQPVIEETVNFEQGKLVKYSMQHKLSGESGSIEVRQGKIEFSHQKDGDFRKNSEPYVENLVTGPTLLLYLGDRIQALRNGRREQVSLAAVDQLETILFDAELSQDSKRFGPNLFGIDIAPHSRILALFVKPFEVTIEQIGKDLRLSRVVAPTGPLLKNGNRWESFQGLMVFRPRLLPHSPSR